MMIQLLYQKVYFKTEDWKNVLLFLKTEIANISIYLLSKNYFLDSLKKMKLHFLGECFIIELPISFLFSFKLQALLNKIDSKYHSCLFFIGLIYNNLFISKLQFDYYFTYFLFRKKNNTNYINSYNQLLLYEFFKFYKIRNDNSRISLFFFKYYSMQLNITFCYYY